MKCSIDMGETLVIRNTENPTQILRLDISQIYCKLFESAREQSRDYLEEIMRWADGNIENYDEVSASLMHCTTALRRSFGIKK